MYFVPEGQHDRSLARSAWEKRHPTEPSRRYGMIGRSYPDIPWVFLVEDVRRIVVLKLRHSNHQFDAHAGANKTVPSGRGPLYNPPRRRRSRRRLFPYNC
jgi:hypothetical protein